MAIDYLKLAWNSIRYRKLRSWLTVIGIIIGVAAIVALIFFAFVVPPVNAPTSKGAPNL